jgi:Zn-dependent protease with chaperone function
VSFAALGLFLLLAVHFVVSSALSLLVNLAVPRIVAAREGDPQRRASVLLGLGLLPALGGLAAAVGLALPAWLVHEPRGGGESAGPVLAALAAGGAVLVLGRAGAALLGQWRTLRLARRWAARGRPLPGLPLPATRFGDAFPVAAVVGVARARLYVADRLLAALSPAELAAVIAHEEAHHAARDNLKRLLLRGSPDLLALSGGGARLREAFEAASEAAADARASAYVPPLVLARALLKVALLVPPGERLEASLAAFHRDGTLDARVRSLVAAHDRSVAGEAPAAAGGRRAGDRGRAAGLAVLALPLLAAAVFPCLRPVHVLLEALVRLLS